MERFVIEREGVCVWGDGLGEGSYEVGGRMASTAYHIDEYRVLPSADFSPSNN